MEPLPAWFIDFVYLQINSLLEMIWTASTFVLYILMWFTIICVGIAAILRVYTGYQWMKENVRIVPRSPVPLRLIVVKEDHLSSDSADIMTRIGEIDGEILALPKVSLSISVKNDKLTELLTERARLISMLQHGPRLRRLKP